MQSANQPAENATGAKTIVLSFIKALNDSNFDMARTHLANNLVFQGVLGTRNSADEYMNDMRKMKFKYAVQKAFEDGNDVCLWYDITMGEQQIFSCGWYKVSQGKIDSFKVLFDPRPLLEQAKK